MEPLLGYFGYISVLLKPELNCVSHSLHLIDTFFFNISMDVLVSSRRQGALHFLTTQQSFQINTYRVIYI